MLDPTPARPSANGARPSSTSFAAEPVVDPEAAWALVDAPTVQPTQQEVVDPAEIWAELDSSAVATTTPAAEPAYAPTLDRMSKIPDTPEDGEPALDGPAGDEDDVQAISEADMWGLGAAWATSEPGSVHQPDGCGSNGSTDHHHDRFLHVEPPWSELDADDVGVLESAGPIVNGHAEALQRRSPGTAQAVVDPPTAMATSATAVAETACAKDVEEILSDLATDPPGLEPADAPIRGGEAAVLATGPTGRFTLSGVAARAGDHGICAIALPSEISRPPDPTEITLEFDGVLNCRTDDARVMSEPGFAPTKAGFTIMGTATAPGTFVLNGTYRLGPARDLSTPM